MSVAHDGLVVDPDIEAEANDIDVGGGIPGRTGVLAVGIAEGDVDAGEFFILQDVSDDMVDAQIGPDGELADTIGVFIRVRIRPELVAQLLIFRAAVDDAVGFDFDGQRRCLDRKSNV